MPFSAFVPNLFRLPSKIIRRRARRSRVGTLAVLLLAALLVVVPFYVIYKPPRLLIRYFAHRWTDVLWEVSLPASASVGKDNNKKPVALTIDDAPSEHTREILDVLAEHGAKATFFVIGAQVAGREDVLAEAVRRGHELGNHAMRDEPARSLPDDVLEDQIRKVQEMIGQAYKTAGRTAPWEGAAGQGGGSPEERGLLFRPGSGFFSDRMRALVRRLGYRLVLGGIYPHDPQIKYWWLNAQHILSMLRPGGIIICHDRRSWTAPMLRSVLPKMKKGGYEAVTITQLLEAAKGA